MAPPLILGLYHVRGIKCGMCLDLDVNYKNPKVTLCESSRFSISEFRISQ